MARHSATDNGGIGHASQTRFAIARRFGLTAAEAAVADILLQGSTYKGAARRLGVSPNTVHTHVKAIHRKAGVGTTLELSALFHEGEVKK